jgi:hypothetical protein
MLTFTTNVLYNDTTALGSSTTKQKLHNIVAAHHQHSRTPITTTQYHTKSHITLAHLTNDNDTISRNNIVHCTKFSHVTQSPTNDNDKISRNNIVRNSTAQK